MALAKQLNLFAFDDEPASSEPVWLEDYEGGHKTVFRMDAEAIVEDLNRMPSGKGSWLRCLEVDHSRSYEEQFKDWDACIWLQRGIGIKKMVRCNGDVMDCIDPHPYKWHYLNGKQIREWKYEALKEAWIDDDILHIRLDSGEYLAQIESDDLIDRYDRHPYKPDFDLEHFAIECYKQHVPKEMMTWRKEYVYGTPALRPFSRNISVEEAKKISLKGDISNGLVRNEQFNQICDCAEIIGIRLQLPYTVPELKNLAMYPVEQTCKTCLRKRSSNKEKDGSCWNDEGQMCCSNYLWNRISNAKIKNNNDCVNCDDD